MAFQNVEQDSIIPFMRNIEGHVYVIMLFWNLS